jgi:uncharacterized protein
MTFNDNANVGGSSATRRGRTVGIAAGGVAGLGGLAVLLLSLFTGGDFSSLLGVGGTDAAGSGTEPLAQCQTGADANANTECYVRASSLVINQFWSQTLQGYTAPSLVIVDQATSSPCGTASNETGPFYCPSDQTVYIDPTFFGLLRSQFGATAGPLAQMYVLAHEYGHHVQDITGIMDAHPGNGTGPASNSVRTELQADCFAGAFIANASSQLDANGNAYIQPPTEDQIKDALNAAAAVGDDHIQQQATGHVNPESFSHGTSAQRQRWFSTGYQNGVNSCDTFSVSGSRL